MPGIVKFKQRWARSSLFWKLLGGTSALMMAAGLIGAWWILFQLKLDLRSSLSIPSTPQADVVIDQAITWALGLMGAGVLAAIVYGYLIAKRMSRSLEEMLKVSEAMLSGSYSEKIKLLTKDELGQLGKNLNRLGSEITSKIETISLERAQLKTILASMIEGIICFDHRGEIKFCNQAAYRLLDVTKSDVRGMNVADVQGFHLLTKYLEQVESQGDATSGELRILRDDSGKQRSLDIRISPFESDTTSGAIAVIHDVTQVRRLEKMRRDFVANVSHEIKTPLTAIRGYVETLLNEGIEDSDLTRRFLEKVERNSKRLSIIVQDILSLARIENQEDSLSVVPTCWHPIIRQILDTYEDIFEEKGLQVIYQPQDIKAQVMGDREAMTQVFDNLITNAIRYTPEGGRVLVQTDIEGEFIDLSVRDTGIGIPSKYQTRIFERFYRVDKARSRDLGGTGLGLAIVKHLVLSMHGHIDVVSEVGQGSCFTVRLPRHRSLEPGLFDRFTSTALSDEIVTL